MNAGVSSVDANNGTDNANGNTRNHGAENNGTEKNSTENNGAKNASTENNRAENNGTEQSGLCNQVTPAAQRALYRRANLWNEDTLALRAATWPGERIAVVDRNGARRRTYAELRRDALRLAEYLRALGIGPGAVISVQLPNVYETVVVALAIQLLGAVINPILPNYREKELAYIFATARPRAIFTPALHRGHDYRAMLAPIKGAVHHVVVDTENSGARGGDADLSAILETAAGAIAADFKGADAEAVSELIFTSGTEANPKAIMHTEQTANFSVRTAYRDLGLEPGDVVWMPSPLGHSTGFNYGLRFALYHGLKLVLQDAWDARAAVQLIRSEGCSYTLAATTFLQDLVETVAQSGASLPFRCFGCGGAPVPAELVERAQQFGIQALRLYGSTEVLVATWNREHSSRAQRLHSDGLVLSDIELDIRADDGRSAAPGEPGEIVVRGPNTSVGFFNDPLRTRATYDAQGWVRSGDMAVRDADGYIGIVGRSKEIIIRGGLNIAPREIEDVLLGFPEVERAAVLPVADARLGERCCAALVFRAHKGFGFAQMLERLERAGMAKYKWPERLVTLSAMPTTASGKIQKHRIAALLQGQRDDDIQLLSDSEAQP